MSSCRKIAVIGSSGQLGSDLVEALGASEDIAVEGLSHDRLDVTDEVLVRQAISEGSYDAVINSAAFHQVDKCEDDPVQAMQTNAVGALNVARACAEAGALSVYISTDYVFSGDKGAPYVEGDTICPLNVYGVSKAAGEMLVRQCGPHLVVRVSSLIGKLGARGKGGNFIEAILGRAKSHQPLQVVSDSWMTPTYTKDAALAMERLLKLGATGTYHVSNQGSCSWYDFAVEAIRLVGLDVPVEPVASVAFPSRAHRPRNSALSVDSLEQATGRAVRPWQEGLRAYLAEKGHLA